MDSNWKVTPRSWLSPHHHAPSAYALALTRRRWDVEHLGSPRYFVDLGLKAYLETQFKRFLLHRQAEDFDGSIAMGSEQHQYLYECALVTVVVPLRIEFPDVVFELPFEQQGTVSAAH